MLLRFKWAILWALGILVLCLMPGKDVPQWTWADLLNLDKPVHATLFGVQTWLLTKAFVARPGNAWSLQRSALTAVLIAVLYGVLTELMQGALMMGRTADINDAIANTVGALVAYWLLRRSERRATMR